MLKDATIQIFDILRASNNNNDEFRKRLLSYGRGSVQLVALRRGAAYGILAAMLGAIPTAMAQQLPRHPKQDAVASPVRDGFSGRLTDCEKLFVGPVHVVFEIKIARPALADGADVGPCTERCTYSAFGQMKAMTVETKYDRGPLFHDRPVVAGDRPDLDEEGNQICWRSLRTDALVGPEISMVFDVQEHLRVRPGSSEVEMRLDKTFVYEYSDGSEDAIYRLFWFRQAVGCPLSKDIERITAIRPKAEGGYEVDVRGRMGTTEWQLEIESEAGTYIPRNVFIAYSGRERLTQRVETSGRVDFDGCALAERGTIVLSPGAPDEYRMDIRLINISRDGAAEHVRAVQDRLTAPRPDDASVFDMRGK